MRGRGDEGCGFRKYMKFFSPLRPTRHSLRLKSRHGEEFGRPFAIGIAVSQNDKAAKSSPESLHPYPMDFSKILASYT